ncbi:MAG: hypothetical protein A2138_05680 [Deltaproteobacteria bacterium RBG_16_71_12]|nr:MAG: hypothetical protein A2138_05680 [Deltaproteobacteria bacterium RBG_16_71_12]
MNAAIALSRLRRLGTPVFTTADGRALFRGTTAGASQTLAALARHGLVVPLRRGLWSLDVEVDPLLLPEHLSAPSPSYVSLQTALYRRGVIEQIPSTIYAVTLGKTKRYHTSVGDYSLHRVAPELFGGFEIVAGGVKLATAEKALADVAYLSGGKSRLFAALPEIELPAGFSLPEARGWLARIPSKRHRTLAERWFEQWVRPHVKARGRRAR